MGIRHTEDLTGTQGTGAVSGTHITEAWRVITAMVTAVERL